MASEYLLKKYKDVKPDEPKELTEKEKRANWWHYHRIPLLIGVIVAAMVGSFAWELVSKVEPDYQIAYFGEVYLEDGVVEQIEARVANLADDRNGDGKVTVQVNSYIINENDPTSYVTQISLMGDISVGQSDFFLLPDPVWFQSEYGMLTMEDGSVYEDGMDPERCIRYAWQDCEALADVKLGEDLYLCQRIFVQEEAQEEHANAANLWTAMTADAAE